MRARFVAKLFRKTGTRKTRGPKKSNRNQPTQHTKIRTTDASCLRMPSVQAVASGKPIDMENFFSRFALDIIGKAVFNYDFNSLTHDDPVIQVL